MIISHQHRYLFVELPHTASTAISKELCLHYGGEPILKKHTPYHKFLKIASPEEKKYFVFSGIRNPLDIAVTGFLKYKNNHNNFYTDPKNWKRNGGFVSDSALEAFRFVQRTHADFPTYFMKYYRWPYDSWSSLDHHHFDFIIRFERLQEDFAILLRRLRIEQVRPLPVVNPTSNKKANFWSYYTPDTWTRAKKVFGPYMAKWGYTFPPEWGDCHITPFTRLQFVVLGIVRRIRWRYVT